MAGKDTKASLRKRMARFAERVRGAVPETVKQVLRVSFELMLVSYVLLVLLAQYIHISFPLEPLGVIIALIGVVSILLPVKKEKRDATITGWHIASFAVLAALGGYLVWLKSAGTGWVGVVITACCALMIFLMGYFVYGEEEAIDVPAPGFRTMLFWSMAVMALLGVIMTFRYGLDAWRLAFVFVYAFFLPGLSLSYAVLRPEELDAIERSALAFCLSISIVPILVFCLFLAGVPISTWSVLGTATVVILGGMLMKSLRRRVQGRFTALFSPSKMPPSQ